MSHLYKRGGFWYVKYYENGAAHYRSLKTKNKKRAQAIQHEIDRRLDNGVIALPRKGKDIDVTSFWQKYLEWACDHKRPHTIETERGFWTQLVRATKIRTLGELTQPKIEKFKSKRLKDVSPGSVNHALRALQGIYNHARKLNLYDGPNPFIGIERYAMPKNPPKRLKLEQAVKLLEAAREDSVDALIFFALGMLAGMRKAEIVFARWEWFDFDAKLITLQNDGEFTLKDKDARTVPLSDDLKSILEPYRQETGYLMRPDKKPGKHRYRYETRKMFDRVVKHAEMPWVTPHMLRHTFGSILADHSVSIYKIQKWMGHSDVRTTQIYAHLQDYDEDINRLSLSLAEDFTGDNSN